MYSSLKCTAIHWIEYGEREKFSEGWEDDSRKIMATSQTFRTKQAKYSLRNFLLRDLVFDNQNDRFVLLT